MHLTANIRSRRVGNRHATIAPYDTFGAADGEFFLAVGNDDQFRRFCAAAGRRGAAGGSEVRDESRARREPHRAARAAVADPVRAAAAYWIEVLTEAGVPCGAVRDVPEALADPQILAREMIQSVEHVAAGMLKVRGRADQAVRHAGFSAHGATDAGTAHSVDPARIADERRRNRALA